MSLTLTALWAHAAWREAARVRATEVDLDHLYLGLLSIGGSAGRVLGRHGISLSSARARAREAMDADLASLGLPDATATLPPPRPLHELGEGDWKVTPRARALIDQAGRAPDTFAILVALMQEPSGTVRRLVAADGVVPQDLVPELKAGSDEAYSAEQVPVVPGLLPEPAHAFRIGTFVSSPPELVADTLADPTFLRVWAYDPDKTTVSADGRRNQLRKGSKSLTVSLACTREREGDAEVITWVTTAEDSAHAGQPITYDRFEVRPAPGGADVTRTSGRRTFGLLGRLIRPVVDRMSTWGLLHTMAATAFGIADRQDA